MSASSVNTGKPCSSIEEVDARWHDLPYMKLNRARYLRSFIREHKISSILELGFYHGKSAAFMAAILEEMGGGGHIVTMDQQSAKERTPRIEETLSSLNLQHRVTPVYAERSFTWELCKLLERKPRPQFDFCYIDGAHTWDGTGYAFFLVDLLLKPGGWVIFDDLDWSIAESAGAKKNPENFKQYSEEEKKALQVRKVWELLVPERGYRHRREEKKLEWGIAQKPAPGIFDRWRSKAG
jgi:predicted O-methyltransferase YrrM